LVTAEGAKEIEEGKMAGADDYPNKPFTIECMKNLIEKFTLGTNTCQFESIS
jgi:hypothetical protein